MTYDGEDSPVTNIIKSYEHDDITVQLNLLFDKYDEYLLVELVEIFGHSYAAGILEFKIEQYNGDKVWYSIDLLKGEDPHVVAI